MQFIQRYIRNWRQKREEKELKAVIAYLKSIPRYDDLEPIKHIREVYRGEYVPPKITMTLLNPHSYVYLTPRLKGLDHLLIIRREDMPHLVWEPVDQMNAGSCWGVWQKELYFDIPEIGAFEYVRMAESQPNAVILRIKLIEPAPVLKYK